jgi:hypothetical protein
MSVEGRGEGQGGWVDGPPMAARCFLLDVLSDSDRRRRAERGGAGSRLTDGGGSRRMLWY